MTRSQNRAVDATFDALKTVAHVHPLLRHRVS